MQVLVTGASGFLGAWLCRRLIDEGLELKILARPTSDLSELKGLRYTLSEGDVTNPVSLETACRDVDSVFHLAGLIGYSRAQRAAMEKVNVAGTQNVIHAVRSSKVRKLVHLSSVTAIGASYGPTVLNEQSEYNIQNLNLGYFETKRAAEILVRETTSRGEIDSVILNPSTIYGGGDAKKGSRKTQVKVAKGKFPFYTNGGVNVVHVKDVTEAIVKGWKQGRSGERYILSSENLTIQQLFQTIAAAAGVEPPKIHLPNTIVHAIGKLGDFMESMGKKGPLNSENAWTSTLYHWFDSAKAQRELGLKLTPAKVSIEESVQWMKDHKVIP